MKCWYKVFRVVPFHHHQQQQYLLLQQQQTQRFAFSYNNNNNKVNNKNPFLLPLVEKIVSFFSTSEGQQRRQLQQTYNIQHNSNNSTYPYNNNKNNNFLQNQLPKKNNQKYHYQIIISSTCSIRNIMGSAFSSPNLIQYEILKKQNADATNGIIEYYIGNREFELLSKYEGDLTLQRDNEDGEKLQKGIDYAKNKGVIDPNYVPEPYVSIDVLGKTPNAVANTIIQSITKIKTEKDPTSTSTGYIVVIVGLSGTGKGTTVTCLCDMLQSDSQQVVTWSNGNIFRSVTLLAVTYCEQQKIPLDQIEKVLTKQNLQAFMGMLSFGKFKNDMFDTHIKGLGLDLFVSDIQNTLLKEPKVSKNIPTVAEVTQGEVIIFAAGAVEKMEKDGIIVLLEGREQTVNYVRSPYRFTLTLSDESLIGKRRAAQRLMGETLKNITIAQLATSTDEDTTTTSTSTSSAITDEKVEEELNNTLQSMVKDIKK